ncbi:MAG TPA: NAD-dependent deacylase [Clostridiaceae bacterium]|nr:NAD-dependent deacylase [Clostridiaceae bacterium]
MKEFIQALRSSKYLLAFTGAGMDTESNLPDFRGPGGLWKNHDPRKLASIQSLHKNYSLFREFYIQRIASLGKASPHRGHVILADWEKSGFLKGIITQNISGLHAAAGNKNVIELHGSIRRVFCLECGAEYSEEDFIDGRKCDCGGLLRPGVTLFGEPLPQDAYRRAVDELAQADMILIMGTSLEVFPAAELPFMYFMKRAYIDLEAYPDRRIDFVFKEKIGTFLKNTVNLLKNFR